MTVAIYLFGNRCGLGQELHTVATAGEVNAKTNISKKKASVYGFDHTIRSTRPGRRESGGK